MIRLLDFSNNTLFVYYLLSNIFYLALLITAFLAAATHRRRLSSLRLETLDESPFTPPITILVPAHDEASTIHESVSALLALDYPALQIVVINDGSTDNTLDVLSDTGGLDTVVHKVVVSELKDDTFYAVIWVEQAGRVVSIDARPSDALALALTTRA